jgi:hypothetical protein
VATHRDPATAGSRQRQEPLLVAVD